MECYTSRGIDLSKVRGQTYDTTSSMSSAVNGVHGRFKAIYNKAIYLPCNAHILNLFISSSCKLPPIRNVIDVMNECYLFFHRVSRFVLQMITFRANKFFGRRPGHQQAQDGWQQSLVVLQCSGPVIAMGRREVTMLLGWG